MRQKFEDLWDNWKEMPPVERVARLMALKDAPTGINCVTVSWIEKKYKEYLPYAEAIVAEVGK